MVLRPTSSLRIRLAMAKQKNATVSLKQLIHFAETCLETSVKIVEANENARLARSARDLAMRGIQTIAACYVRIERCA